MFRVGSVNFGSSRTTVPFLSPPRATERAPAPPPRRPPPLPLPLPLAFAAPRATVRTLVFTVSNAIAACLGSRRRRSNTAAAARSMRSSSSSRWRHIFATCAAASSIPASIPASFDAAAACGRISCASSASCFTCGNSPPLTEPPSKPTNTRAASSSLFSTRIIAA